MRRQDPLDALCSGEDQESRLHMAQPWRSGRSSQTHRRACVNDRQELPDEKVGKSSGWS